jgi:hypothetical protein
MITLRVGRTLVLIHRDRRQRASVWVAAHVKQLLVAGLCRIPSRRGQAFAARLVVRAWPGFRGA